MRFLAERAVAHCAGFKTFTDAVYRFYLFDRYRQPLRSEGQHTAQVLIGKSTAVQFAGKAFEHSVIVFAAGLLQCKNSLRIEHMPFAAAAPLVNTAGFIAAQIRRISFEGRQMTQFYFFGDLVQADPFQSGRCAGEIFFDHTAADADSFKNLGAAIRLHCRNTHFGKDLGDTVGAGVDIICGGLLYCNAGDHTVRAHFFDRFKRQVGIDAADAIAKQQCKMMHFARFGRFDNNRSFEPAAAFDQMMMQAGAGQKGRNSRHFFVHFTVR